MDVEGGIAPPREKRTRSLSASESMFLPLREVLTDTFNLDYCLYSKVVKEQEIVKVQQQVKYVDHRYAHLKLLCLSSCAFNSN